MQTLESGVAIWERKLAYCSTRKCLLAFKELHGIDCLHFYAYVKSMFTPVYLGDSDTRHRLPPTLYSSQNVLCLSLVGATGEKVCRKEELSLWEGGRRGGNSTVEASGTYFHAAH